MNVIDWIVQLMGIALALAAAPVFIGWVNQCRAWLQNKSAPSILQPYRAIRKLFHKDAVIAENASRLFRLAPYLRNHGAADDRRTPFSAELHAQPESRFYRSRVHDGVAGRECPYPG